MVNKQAFKKTLTKTELIEKIEERIIELDRIKEDVLNSKIYRTDEKIFFRNNINSRKEELKSLIQQLKDNIIYNDEELI